jgi:predicted phage terminase large subunit-like protein
LRKLPAKAQQEYLLLIKESQIRLERKRQQDPEFGLINFVRYFWSVLEPNRKFAEGWALEAMCLHLQAITSGRIHPARLLMNVPPGSMKPVHVDELIMTRRGYVRLGEVAAGDEVLTHKGRFRRVTAVHEQGVLPLLRVSTFGGRETRTAQDHPFLTPRGWVAAADLVPGKDYVGTPRVVEEFGDGSMSPEEARLLGYLVGDGSISHRSLSFASGDDESRRDFIYCAASCGFHASIAKSQNEKMNALKVVLKSGNTRTPPGTEPPILDWLRKHGLYCSNSYTKRIPSGVFSSGPEAIKNFIGAYWSCDGMIRVRHQGVKTTMMASATTVSSRLAEDMQRALALIGISSRIRKKCRNLVSVRQPGGRYTSFDVLTQQRNEVAKFAKLPGLLGRKRKLTEMAFPDRFEPDIYEDEVLSVEPDGEGECRCLTVDEDQSFTSNGLIVHNSLLTNVFWPAWEWTAAGRPDLRYISFSYASHLTERDNQRFIDLMTSRQFQDVWGHTFALKECGKVKVSNDKTGWKFASSVRGVGTGERGDRILFDDPHSVKDQESKLVREETVRWFNEGMRNRLNDENSAIVVIMQRVHEMDVSGAILSQELNYEHLMIQAEYDPGVHCRTSIGWEDPRTEAGECFWPSRFPPAVIEDAKSLGPYAWASQYLQIPSPRGGGIFKRDWWNIWDPEDGKYPSFSFIVAALDGAFTEKEENDPSGFTIWGLNTQSEAGPRIFLIDAWSERLPIHGEDVPREAGESELSYRLRAKEKWGLVERVTSSCKRFKVDKLLIESKGPGWSVAQEISRLMFRSQFGIDLVDPGRGDKMARALRVQHMASAMMLYRPPRKWAEAVEDEMANFPRATHDDLLDSSVMALNYLRTSGMIERTEEREYREMREHDYIPQQAALYPC